MGMYIYKIFIIRKQCQYFSAVCFKGILSQERAPLLLMRRVISAIVRSLQSHEKTFHLQKHKASVQGYITYETRRS
jgi:hypothetical protein